VCMHTGIRRGVALSAMMAGHRPFCRVCVSRTKRGQLPFRPGMVLGARTIVRYIDGPSRHARWEMRCNVCGRLDKLLSHRVTPTMRSCISCAQKAASQRRRTAADACAVKIAA
jgi:hypothetical protein